MVGEIEKLNHMSILSATQFTRPMLDELFTMAAYLQEQNEKENFTAFRDLLRGRIMAPLFFENSSRTFGSFCAAFKKLGGGVVTLPIERSSFATKGETLQDTVITMDMYADVIVLRHPDHSALSQATAVASHPIINAGNGIGEHPTQALLDAFTIQCELKSIEGKVITIVGDLKHGRTVHSLIRTLCLFQVSAFVFVSPPGLQLPQEELDYLMLHKIPFELAEELNEKVVEKTDCLYVTRIQKERFRTEEDYEMVKGSYTVSPATLIHAKKTMAVMHPLPRNEELSMELDTDPRAAYFRQMRYGLFVRMALLLAILNPKEAVKVLEVANKAK